MINIVCIVTILLATIYGRGNSETIHETLGKLREKVRHLEATKQIVRDYEPYTEPELRDEEEYDFVVIGTGSAGSAIIHRLTENANWKILALEAGGEPDILSDIPFWSPMVESTNLNWGYLTEKEENLSLGLIEQRMHWPRGKVLGGSSILNYMVTSRGAKEDYDKWEGLGNPGWSYKEILPYLKKIETCNIEYQDKEFRGHEGPIFIEDVYRDKAADIFVEAAKNAGYRYVDYNGESLEGVSYMQGMTKKGLRCSGESCYIKPIKNRRNLVLRLNSHVTKLLIKDNTVLGVEFVKDEKKYNAYATKEVILSAGTINSAQILLLSGIGPKRQLENVGITPVLDLPVGQKMYDHQAFIGLGFTVNESIGVNVTSAFDDSAFKELYNEGKGPLHSIGGINGILFTKTHLAPDAVPDIELLFYPLHFSQDPDNFARIIRLSKDLYNKMYKEYENKHAISCNPILLHPKSFGRLELRSDNPFDHPKIYAGYYTDPEGNDIKTLTAGIREAIRVILSPPFDKYDIKVIDKPIYGCEHLDYDSDPYWECAIRHMTTTVFHHTTTCKMGPADDPEAVVDNRLRVYGIDKLRVADASVIPIQITGHTNIPAVLVGEKLADIIKEEYLK